MLILSGRIPIRVNPFFLLMAVIIGWINSFTIIGTLIWIGVITISVLIHEFGHALTAIWFGHRAQIDLTGFGGLTSRHGPRLKLWQEFLIVANGPLAGFALFGIAYQVNKMIVGQPLTPFNYAVTIAMYVNLFWTAVNLLPIQPLDGGHLFRIILEGIFGIRGIKIAQFVSVLLAGAISVLFLINGILLMAMLFFLFAFENYRSWKVMLSFTEQDQNEQLQVRFKEAEREMRLGNLDYAFQQFQRVREQSKQGILHTVATQGMARILNQYSSYTQAYELLNPLRTQLDEEGLLLLHQLAFQAEKWEDAIALGNRVYQYFPTSGVALINAISHSVMGHIEPALGWLQTAISEGLPNVKEVLNKREFDSLRGDPRFRAIEQQAD